ncbi:MAG: hypothetical protein AAF492_01515, partial [Verrucomicrobiota bacterium]
MKSFRSMMWLLALPAAMSVTPAETLPPPTFKELLRADVIVKGRFVEKPAGTISLEADEVLKGECSEAQRLIASPRPGNLYLKNGQIHVDARDGHDFANMTGMSRRAGETTGLWF